MPVRSLPSREAAPRSHSGATVALGLSAALLVSAGSARADLHLGQAVTNNNLSQTISSGATTEAPAIYTVTDGPRFALSQTSNTGGGVALARVSGLEGGAFATTLLRYQITLVGPAGGPVGVNVQANGYVQGSGVDLNFGNNLYYAQALFLLRTPTLVRVLADTRIPTGPQAFALNTTAFFAPNVSYFVDLSAEAAAGAPHGFLNASTAEAFVDPVFTIDPTFAALYHFVGIPIDAPTGGVPEASTWVMLLMGFAGLGATLRLRRKTLRCAAA